jgi:threonylcarbamoyladenosine tRNA methylthiotransferase MtaB
LFILDKFSLVDKIAKWERRRIFLKIAFKTIGCKLNHAEVEEFKKELVKLDFELVNGKNTPDLYIFNTCCVTTRASYKCRQGLRQLFKKYDKVKIIVVGCYVRLYPEDFKKFFPEANLVLRKTFDEVWRELVEISEDSLFQKREEEVFGRTRAFLKIQDGCDRKCAYCVVPLARGKSRSRPPAEILNLIKNLIAQGYEEIVLTGANLGSYCFKNTTLADLLREIQLLPGLGRLRLSSLEIDTLTEELIEVILSSPKICHHLHLPLQSGSERILKKMQRNYSLSQYETLISWLKKSWPDLNLGTDLIIGFPGEEEEDFQATYNFIKKNPFTYLHLFPYSPRPKTSAYTFPETVSPAEKKKRYQILKKLSLEKLKAFQQKFLYQNLEVIVENKRDKTTHLLKGISSNYLKILFKGDDKLKRQLVKVKLTAIENNQLYGEKVEEK